ncbi:HD-GYP domain-containing protein [Bacillus sp. BRMEA1]|uniref:HD-GYP domain-containing protein n=1 Tax=Neobacillus endophyticus TaxID=2738405 RepID=UPI0015655672|nr:HD-GYP domain-containing protein [Neobacillus endophyticus]NRD79131.1 HD-GYP domain-containing protein [Neobacillus endophyticus]
MSLMKGTRLKEDIYTVSGVLLLKRGTLLTENHIDWLNSHKTQIKWGLSSNENSEEKPWPLNEVVYKNVYTSIKGLQETIGKKTHLEDNEILGIMSEFDILHQEYVEKDVEILDIMEKFSKDEYLFKHSINVGLIASKIGNLLSLPEEHQHMLGRLGLFHDVGKFKIDPAILNKPTRLTDEEFNLIKQHPRLGYDLLSSTSLDPLILEGVLKHHEREDGTGYPGSIKGDSIPFFVKILSVADSFDAICSIRVYKEQKSVYYAIEELIKDAQAKRLDMSIVRPFTYSLMNQLKGSKIKLRNGAHGEIYDVHPQHPNQPILKINGFQPLNLFKEQLTLHQVADL